MKSHAILPAIIIGALLGIIPGFASALPPIVIYNYTPALPAFQLIGSTPRDHQSFNVAPEKVSLSFNEAISPDNAEIKLFDPANNPMQSKNAFPSATVIETTVPAHLLAGTYRAEWKVQCGCAENTALNGILYFTIY